MSQVNVKKVTPSMFTINIKDLQKRWNCSRQTCYRVFTEPGFPVPLNVYGRPWWRQEQIDEWEAKQISVLKRSKNASKYRADRLLILASKLQDEA